MSRIGRQPIELPSSVSVALSPGRVQVNGPLGELSQVVPQRMKIEQAEGAITVTRPTERGPDRALHGLTRTLIANMVEGVTKGFEKHLEIQGVGYRASLRGSDLKLNVVLPRLGRHAHTVPRRRRHAGPRHCPGSEQESERWHSVGGMVRCRRWRSGTCRLGLARPQHRLRRRIPRHHHPLRPPQPAVAQHQRLARESIGQGRRRDALPVPMDGADRYFAA